VTLQARKTPRDIRAGGLLDQDSEAQVGQVLRILQGSWAQFARDLEFLEKSACASKA
jgi:hypothetical protein